jgi:cell division protein FtsL
MVRLLNVAAIVALIGSAIYAYSIKYQTIFYAEEIAHLQREIGTEKDSIGLLRADFTHLARPERISALADRFLALQKPNLMQIVPIDGLPDKHASDDAIAHELEALGLAEPTNTPRDTTSQNPTTPSVKPR